MNMPKLTKRDIVAIIGLIILIIILTIPTYIDKGDCEVARPGFKCASVKDVMTENCDYWAKYGCDTSADVSLKQIEWYIGNLCKLEKKVTLDCNNLKLACNQITGKEECTVGLP